MIDKVKNGGDNGPAPELTGIAQSKLRQMGATVQGVLAKTEADRLASVNEFIKVIGSCGRKFFRNDANDRFANMEVDAQGKVWFIDDYTTRRIYTHYERCWSGFSHGGTLRDLVRVFREHIKRGVQIHSKYFQARSWMSGGHPWGYPEEDLRRLESEGRRLGIVAEEQEQAS